MSAPHPHDRIQRLLAERAWVRRLAGVLVRDAATADDLVQDTYVAALERCPETPHSPRAWLGTVVRNLARNRHRGEARRRVRESAVPGRSVEPPAADAVARAELVERLARLVLDLPEPYRTTVVLRFFEDKPPRKVAAALGIPVETVRTRLKRALAMLKQGLDETHEGGRRTWLAAFVPIASFGREGAPVAASVGKGIAVDTASKSTVVGVGLAVAATALLVAVWLGIDALTGDTEEPSAPPLAQGRSDTVLEDTPEATLTGSAPAATDAAAQTESENLAVSGVVRRAGRHPAADVQVTLRLDGRTLGMVTTNVEGSYRLPLSLVPADAKRGTLSLHAVSADGLSAMTSRSLPLAPDSDAHLGALVLGPAHDLGVRATGPDGLPIPAAVLLSSGANGGVGALIAAQAGVLGEVTFRDLPEAVCRVLATAMEHSRVARFVRIPQDTRELVELRLGEGRSLTVRVVKGEEAHPVEGIELRVYEKVSRGGVGHMTIPYLPAALIPATDANGTSVIRGMGVGDEVQVGIASEPYANRRIWVPVGPEQETLTLTLPELTAPSWPLVDGEVEVPPDGTPVKLEWVIPSRNMPDTAEVVNGDLVIRNVLAQRLQAWARTPEGAAADLRIEKGETKGPETAFSRPRTLKIQGTYEDGAPLAGAVVRGGSSSRTPHETRLDADGRGRLTGLTPGKNYLFLVSPGGDGWRYGSVGSVDLSAGNESFSFSIPHEEEIQVRILRDGKPILPDRYELSLEPGAISASTEDPAGGTVTVRWRPEGTHRKFRLTLDARGHPAVRAWIERDMKTVDLHLEPGGTIDVEVLPPADGVHRTTPQRWDPKRNTWMGSGGRVRVAQSCSLPDLDWRRVGRLAEGTYRLCDRMTGATTGAIELAAGAHATLRLDLSGGGPVRGRVEAPEGTDLTKARVYRGTPEERAANTPRFGLSASVKQDGTFETRMHGQGPMTFHVAHPLLPTTDQGIVTVTEPTDDIVLELAESWARKITFVSDVEVTRHVSTFRILLYANGLSAKPDHALKAPVTRDGRHFEATVGDFPPGRWTLWIDPRWFVPVVIPDVDLSGSDPRLRGIRLHTGASVHVKVLVPEGGETPIMMITLTSDDLDLPRYERTDGEQATEWTVRGLGAGRYQLKVIVIRDLADDENPPGLEEAIDIREGETIERVIDLR